VQVKFNVNRVDNMVIQAIALLDTLDKDINTFVMRVREWYSWHFPELVKVVPDNYQYSRLALFIKEKTSLSEDSIPGEPHHCMSPSHWIQGLPAFCRITDSHECLLPYKGFLGVSSVDLAECLDKAPAPHQLSGPIAALHMHASPTALLLPYKCSFHL